MTNNGRTTEGEYRVALPDGRVQVTILHNEVKIIFRISIKDVYEYVRPRVTQLARDKGTLP